MNTDIGIYKLDIRNISRSEFEAAYFLMSEERQNKCKALRREDDRLLCIAADMLLRRLLSDRLHIHDSEIVFFKAENGKPYIHGADVFFNVSHSENMVAAAVSEECDVGVDIEYIRPIKARIAERFCSEKEKKYIFGEGYDKNTVIEDRDVLERFFRVWTYKEAVVKCTGQGIREDLIQIEYDESRCFSELSDGYCLSVVTKEQLR